MDCRQVVPRDGGAWVGLGQMLSNRERRPITLQRLGQVALLLQNVSDLAVRYRQISLPGDVARVSLGQALNGGDGGPISLQHLSQVTLPPDHLGDVGVRYR